MIKYFTLIFIFVSYTAFGSGKLYPYCNVFIGTACFGVKSGDEYKFTSNVDFRIYELKLSSGDKINIYSGYHPNSFDFDNAYLVKDSISGYLVSAHKLNSKRHRVLIEPTRKRVPSVDIEIIIFGNDKRIIEDFLSSFKACTSAKLSTSCIENSLFKNIVL